MNHFLLRNRRWLAETAHMAIAAAALAASFLLRFDFTLDPAVQSALIRTLPLDILAKLMVFRGFSLREMAWRYLGFRDLVRLTAANLVGSGAAALAIRGVLGEAFPRSIHFIDFLVCLAGMAALRAAIRLGFELDRTDAPRLRRIAIYGAGSAGVTLAGEIRTNPRMGYEVAGFFDDDRQKQNLRVNGVRVLGGRDVLPKLVRKHRVEEVLIALPSATGSEITEILERCHAARVAAKRIPALAELIDHQVLMSQIREVRLEDLLGRPPASLDQGEIRARIAGRTVLVTGAGGSIGSELCRQIARYSPRAIVGFEQAETAIYEIDREMKERFPGVAFYPEVGSIRNRQRLEEVFEKRTPFAVYHAAAYKHVPMMEAHPFEAVENNVFGTRNVARTAALHGVEEFVLISSDKAVRPANIMGATKRLAEMVCLAEAREDSTRFVAARFGNVLGSSGSVIPLFKRQIAAGGPLTVTHPGMKRFFMTVSEAAQLVLQASAMGKGGEIFVLEMGEPLLIVDLARRMVLLSGLKPDEDIQIEFCGARPGEKLAEELAAMGENTLPTRHSQIRILAGGNPSSEAVVEILAGLKRSVDARDVAGLLLSLKEAVPDYNPSGPMRSAVRKELSKELRKEKVLSVVASAG